MYKGCKVLLVTFNVVEIFGNLIDFKNKSISKFIFFFIWILRTFQKFYAWFQICVIGIKKDQISFNKGKKRKGINIYHCRGNNLQWNIFSSFFFIFSVHKDQFEEIFQVLVFDENLWEPLSS